MPRRHLPQALLIALTSAALWFLGPACMAVDEPSSTPSSQAATQSQDSPLASVTVDNLEVPGPSSEGLLCVTLSSASERTLDQVAVVPAGQSDEPLHTFSDLGVSADGMKSCTTTCLCYGPDPPPLDVLLRDGDAERRVASETSAPAGCCETQ